MSSNLGDLEFDRQRGRSITFGHIPFTAWKVSNVSNLDRDTCKYTRDRADTSFHVSAFERAATGGCAHSAKLGASCLLCVAQPAQAWSNERCSCFGMGRGTLICRREVVLWRMFDPVVAYARQAGISQDTSFKSGTTIAFVPLPQSDVTQETTLSQ